MTQMTQIASQKVRGFICVICWETEVGGRVESQVSIIENRERGWTLSPLLEVDFGGAGATQVLRGMAETADRRVGPADISHHLAQNSSTMAVHHPHRRCTGGKCLVEKALEILTSALAVESDNVDFSRGFFSGNDPNL